MEILERKKHWENIYETKAPDQVSWFQVYPKTSMEFVSIFDLPKNAAIIDIGGGDSNFVDYLVNAGYVDITVLDISANAIDRAKARLGPKAGLVQWIVSDVTEFIPLREYDFWHDRAAFHFLINEDQVNKYVEIASKGTRKEGVLILGTFSETGPKKCSGLEIKQYSPEGMSQKFEREFNRIKCIHEDHHTPFNTIQNFLFCSFRKK
jgi:SAM-dependent methyltransferase